MAERPEVAVESGAEAVCALADEEFRAMESADVPAFMALLAPDVLFLPPNDRPKEGGGVAPWIREFLKGISDAPPCGYEMIVPDLRDHGRSTVT
jgi:ketosteroid isomerase-like protein